jgi:RNA polymerase sigma-70 factor (ECF subfamily)
MGGTQEATDESLLAAYGAGDPDAFEALFRRYQAPLRRHLERMLADRTAAEDVLIETFCRLHRHRTRLRPGARVRPWLYTIANNLARNQRRRERLVHWLPLGAKAPEPAVPAAEDTDEIRRRVAAALDALPPRQREACSLRLLADLGLEEIAQVTGTSIGTVKSRLFYGQRRLRVLLGDLDPGGER